jgi:hypothetical protein
MTPTALALLRAEHTEAIAVLERLTRLSTSPDADTELGEARGRVQGLARAIDLLSEQDPRPVLRGPKPKPSQCWRTNWGDHCIRAEGHDGECELASGRRF